MTKAEIVLLFEVGCGNQSAFEENLREKCPEDEYESLRQLAEEMGVVGDEKQISLDSVLREKVFGCTEEEYEWLCEKMEEQGYFDERVYPFCAEAEDSDEGRQKALRWISENSELLKNLVEEYDTCIQLSVKLLVGDSLAEALGFGEVSPLGLVFSADDLALLQEHKIKLRISAEYTDDIDI